MKLRSNLVVEGEEIFQWADPWMILMMMMKIHLRLVHRTLE